MQARPRERFRLARISVVVICAIALASHASGDPPPPRETRLIMSGRSVAVSDETSAIAENPANVAFLPGAEARYTWVRTAMSSPEPQRGHIIALGAPLPFNL